MRLKLKGCEKQGCAAFQKAHFDILYGAGTSREGEILDLGADCKIVEICSWYSYNGEKIGQLKTMHVTLIEHPELAF